MMGLSLGTRLSGGIFFVIASSIIVLWWDVKVTFLRLSLTLHVQGSFLGFDSDEGLWCFLSGLVRQFLKLITVGGPIPPLMRGNGVLQF